MIFVFSLFTLTILFNFLQTSNSASLRSDYYKSFSIPNKCLKLSHYYPSGPLYLFISFQYTLYSFIYGYEANHIVFNVSFKKIDGNCENSLIFTTMGKDFKKFELKIFIYLYKSIYFIANAEYTFYKGISVDGYHIWDHNQHYSVFIIIHDDMKNYFISSNIYTYQITNYLKSVSTKRGEICLITNNNDAIVLKPKYSRIISNGLLTGFRVNFFLNGNYVRNKLYVAFECNKTAFYPNETTILIIDPQKYDIYFVAVYCIFDKGDIKIIEKDLKLGNVKFENISNMINIPIEYKKLFLIKYTIVKTRFHGRMTYTTFFSRSGIVFCIREQHRVNTTIYLEYMRNILYYPTGQY